MYEIINR